MDSAKSPAGAAEAGIKSIEVGGRILLSFIGAAEPMALSELAALARMSPSKAHRYLVSFQRLGLVVQDPQTSRYALGGAAIRLGLAAAGRTHPQQALRRVQQTLRDGTGQTVILSIWTDGGPLIMSVEEGLAPVVATMRVGAALPLLDSAAGRLFAAFMPESALGQVLPGRRHPDLEREIEAIRERGLERRDDSLLPNISAIAAPFFDWRGELVGVLSVIGHRGQQDFGFEGSIARQLRTAAGTFRDQAVL